MQSDDRAGVLLLVPQLIAEHIALSQACCDYFLTARSFKRDILPVKILKVVISKFLRLVFVHSYFTAAFYIINIMYMPALYLANIPQFY